MKNTLKKYRKYIVLLLLLLFLVGCKRITNADGTVMEKYIIALGDKFPWGQEGYGWFDTLIVWPFAQLFNIVAKFSNAGISIIVVTLLIDIVKFGSTTKSTISQQKMQALTPEVNRIKEKYKNRQDQQARLQESTEIQKLYEKNDINMLGSMLPTFLQLPIIIAVYQGLQRADSIINGSMFGYDLMHKPSWGLTNLNNGGWFYVAIFVMMIAAQTASIMLPPYIQNRKLSKAKKANSAPQNQGMMMMSIGMIVLIAYNMNIGMSIYFGITSLSRLVQTIFINWKYIDSK